MEKVDTPGANRGPQSAGEPRPRGLRLGRGGAEEERGELGPERKQPNLGWALRMENSRGGGAPESGERPRAPAGERESGVCAVLLVNKKERGGASYCSAGKLQLALLIGLAEP